ncbi:MAG: OmcA/MtrC family decaheme c-type cytochrome [Candidatus Hinthialibacter antarcticus]|nr:OmcA/MtrC family decaheme c-type cytochrome [Candidatus Hinthialibacter antarcticus]
MKKRNILSRILVICMMMAAPVFAMAAGGLSVTIDNVTINDAMQPVVSFEMLDDGGNPVAISDVSYRFAFARLEVLDAAKGSSRYVNYVVNVQTVPEGYENAGASAEQGSYDSRGAITDFGGGRYLYTFDNVVPADFDSYSGMTHTMSAQIQRTYEEKSYIANPLFHYVPNGGEVTELRKVATTEGCNKCHSSLALHGSGRREIGYCILCHNPQSVDPDTGNTVDMAVMTHKIHMGSSLPSVEAGGSYKIVGYRQSTHDYSHVVFPQDIRNCETCHAGPDAEVWKTAPSRAVCASCHDDVNFETGENHGSGIPQANDDMCTQCHQADGDEFGISVAGAHTIPVKSAKNKGLIAEIIEASNTANGEMPIVKFTLKDGEGNLVALESLSRLRLIVGAPTSDYASYYREDMLTDPPSVTLDGDVYTYTMTTPIADDIQGSIALAIESRISVLVIDVAGEDDDVSVNENTFNPVFYAAVTDSAPVARRMTISQEKCEACHDRLEFHGGSRRNVEYCLVCHNPRTSDVEERPEGVMGGESVGMAYMIHKIHKGETLEKPFLVFGHNSSEHDFNEVLFPGSITECSLCHTTEVPNLPLPSGVMPIEFLDKELNLVKIPPTTAACISCHDNDGAIAHAELNTTSGGVESCAVCHQGGRSSDIIKAHEDDSFLNVIEVLGSDDTSVGPWDIH